MTDYSSLVKNPIWMAGFFDGEGCVSIRRSFDSRRLISNLNLLVSISQKDTTVLGLIVVAYGGKLNNCAGIHEVRWHGKASKEFIETILPYSVVKRTQLEIALEFISTLVPYNTAIVPHDLLKRRYELADLCRMQKGRLQ